ncbi:hypothetical protein C8R43DRAFT_1120011 [Mycena crocata]|nr:hypothetical protein C8R43DRAFT_1120011 [Mycena crocata]
MCHLHEGIPLTCKEVLDALEWSAKDCDELWNRLLDRPPLPKQDDAWYELIEPVLPFVDSFSSPAALTTPIDSDDASIHWLASSDAFTSGPSAMHTLLAVSPALIYSLMGCLHDHHGLDGVPAPEENSVVVANEFIVPVALPNDAHFAIPTESTLVPAHEERAPMLLPRASSTLRLNHPSLSPPPINVLVTAHSRRGPSGASLLRVSLLMVILAAYEDHLVEDEECEPAKLDAACNTLAAAVDVPIELAKLNTAPDLNIDGVPDAFTHTIEELLAIYIEYVASCGADLPTHKPFPGNVPVLAEQKPVDVAVPDAFAHAAEEFLAISNEDDASGTGRSRPRKYSPDFAEQQSIESLPSRYLMPPRLELPQGQPLCSTQPKMHKLNVLKLCSTCRKWTMFLFFFLPSHLCSLVIFQLPSTSACVRSSTAPGYLPVAVTAAMSPSAIPGALIYETPPVTQPRVGEVLYSTSRTAAPRYGTIIQHTPPLRLQALNIVHRDASVIYETPVVARPSNTKPIVHQTPVVARPNDADILYSTSASFRPRYHARPLPPQSAHDHVIYTARPYLSTRPVPPHQVRVPSGHPSFSGRRTLLLARCLTISHSGLAPRSRTPVPAEPRAKRVVGLR